MEKKAKKKMEFRMNLFVFGMILLLSELMIIIFAYNMFTNVIGELTDDVKLAIVVGIFGLINAIIGGVVGYCIGIQQSLTAPADPAATMTEAQHDRDMERWASVYKKED